MKRKIVGLLSLVLMLLMGCNNAMVSTDNDSAAEVGANTDKQPVQDEKEPSEGDKEGQNVDSVEDNSGTNQEEEVYAPEYLEVIHIDEMEELSNELEQLEKYNHGCFVSYNPETRELVLKMYEWITVRPEDDPEEKYPSGFRLEELGEETFILPEDCEMWLFVEGSSFFKYGKVELQEIAEMIENGYAEQLLMVVYRDGEDVQYLMQQYVP